MPSAGLIALAAVAASGFWTAADPFAGTWTLAVAKSRIVDQVQVELTAPNRFTFHFENYPAETVVADGTGQPGVQGSLLSATPTGPRSLTIERKKDGRTLLVAKWKLSGDGAALRDDFTAFNSDGTSATTPYLYVRKSKGKGFAGLWESTTPPVGLAYDLKIAPAGAKSLSFDVQGAVKTVSFDGEDHPTAAGGLSASGRRAGPRVLDMTDRAGGKTVDTRTYRLSPDGKTLTLTVRPAGQSTPNILIFERK